MYENIYHLASIAAMLLSGLGFLYNRIGKKFDQVEKKFDRIEKQFDKMEVRFEMIDEAFHELRTEMRCMETRLQHSANEIIHHQRKIEQDTIALDRRLVVLETIRDERKQPEVQMTQPTYSSPALRRPRRRSTGK